jgi:hypothetical protein
MDAVSHRRRAELGVGLGAALCAHRSEVCKHDVDEIVKTFCTERMPAHSTKTRFLIGGGRFDNLSERDDEYDNDDDDDDDDDDDELSILMSALDALSAVNVTDRHDRESSRVLRGFARHSEPQCEGGERWWRGEEAPIAV